MTHLKITLLGHPAIVWEGQPLTISRKATRTLLYYLASQETGVGRQSLGGLFWPEANESTNRNNVRSLLGKLRSSLPDPELVTSLDGLVSLDFSRVEVDKSKFEAIYRDLENKPWSYPDEIPLPIPLLNPILEALGCWSGSHFLEQAELVSTPDLDEWLLYTDMNLVTFRQRLMRRAADHYLAINEPGMALKWLINLTSYDWLNPELNYQIINLLLQSGRIQNAKNRLSAFKENYKKVVKQPLPEQFKELETRIDEPASYEGTRKVPAWPYPIGMNTFLVGRTDEVEVLMRAFNNGGIAFVSGDEGCGKTRIIQEIYKRVWQGVRLLVLKCSFQDPPTMMDAFVEMLQSQITEEEWKLLPNVWSNMLSLLAPEVKNIKSNIITPEHMMGKQGQRLIYEAVLNLFQVCGREKKLLIVLDNAQWADDATLSVLQFLVTKKFFNRNRMLVITYSRQEEKNILDKYLKNMSKTYAIDHVDLSPLNENEVKQLVDQIIPGSATDEFVRLLTSTTGGNPFFIIETVRTMLDEFPDTFQDLYQLINPFPKSIQLLQHTRLSRLSVSSLAALQAAAVAGFSEIKPSIISKMMQKSTSEIIDAFNNLTRKGFLRVMASEDQAGKLYQFSHDLIRSTVLDTLSHTDLIDLHTRAANIIEHTYVKLTSKQVAEIADHYEIANMIEKAIDKWLLVAKNNWNVYALEDTRKVYNHIHYLLDKHHEEISIEQVARVYHQENIFAYESADGELLRRLANECLTQGEVLDDPLLIGTGLFVACDAAYIGGQPEKALENIEKAITFLEISSNDQILREAYLHKGMLLNIRQCFKEAMQTYQNIFANEEKVTEPAHLRMLFESYFHLAMLLFRTGHPIESLEKIESAFDRYQYILSPYNKVQAMLVFGYVHSTMGEYQTAVHESMAGIEISKAMQNQMLIEYNLFVLARSELRLGLLDQAEIHARELLQSSLVSGRKEMFIQANGLLASIYFHLDDYDQAAQILTPTVKEPHTSQIYYENLCQLSLSYAFIGKMAESEAILKDVQDYAWKKEMNGIFKLSQLVQANNLLLKGDFHKAEDLLTLLEKTSKEDGLLETWHGAQQALYVIYMNSGKHEKAEDLFIETMNWAEKTNCPWAQIRSLLAWLDFNKTDDENRKARLGQLNSLINFLEANVHSEEIWEVFNQAKNKWLGN